MIDFNGLCWLVLGIFMDMPWGALVAAIVLYYMGKSKDV